MPFASPFSAYLGLLAYAFGWLAALTAPSMVAYFFLLAATSLLVAWVVRVRPA